MSITVKSFFIKGEEYQLAISPDLQFSSPGNFVGNYKGLLINPNNKIDLFTLSPDENYTDDYLSWSVIPEGCLKPAIVDEINKIIKDIQSSLIVLRIEVLEKEIMQLKISGAESVEQALYAAEDWCDKNNSLIKENKVEQKEGLYYATVISDDYK